MFAVIHIPGFSLQSVLRHEPDLIPKPVVLTDPALTKPCVTQLTPAARASGICAGMSPSQAMARCGNLVVKTRSLSQEQGGMETLMQTAYAFSPHIEATAPGVCTIELKGLAIQTNETSAKQWATQILQVLKQFHLNGQIGFAETPALALLAAHAARPILIAQSNSVLQSQRDCALQPRVGELASLPWVGEQTCLNPERVPPRTLNTPPQHAAEKESNFISTLPIEALDLPYESLEILKRWGINTAGAFLALGKDQLTERLGPTIVEIFDRLSTQSVRPLKIAAPPETFAEEIEFENEIETLEPLLFILRRFVEQLSRRIELLYLVVAELHLKLGLTSGATYERAFTIPSPTGNAETLFRVLHTHLETVRTHAPIMTLRLSAKPGRSESHQFGLFETTLRNPNQFAETLARLIALCGSDRVGTPVVEATYRPDTFQMKAPDFKTCFERRRSARRPGSQHVRLRDERGTQCDALSVSQRLRAGTSRAPAPVSKCLSRGLPLRRFRPPLPARIETCEHHPVLMRSAVFNGVIADIRGPFFSSGNWWENNRWCREEWDIQTSDGTLYRIFRAAEEVGKTVGRACCPVRAALAPPTTLASNEHDPSPQSGIGLPHSRPLREAEKPNQLRQVLECPPSAVAEEERTSPEECARTDSTLMPLRALLRRTGGSPMPLSSKADEHTQSFESVTADSGKLSLTPCFSGVYERPEDNINCFNSFSTGPPQHSRMSDATSPSNPASSQFFVEGIYD